MSILDNLKQKNVDAKLLFEQIRLLAEENDSAKLIFSLINLETKTEFLESGISNYTQNDIDNFIVTNKIFRLALMVATYQNSKIKEYLSKNKELQDLFDDTEKERDHFKYILKGLRK